MVLDWNLNSNLGCFFDLPVKKFDSCSKLQKKTAFHSGILLLFRTLKIHSGFTNFSVYESSAQKLDCKHTYRKVTSSRSTIQLLSILGGATNQAVLLTETCSCSRLYHGSYEWIIMLEKCGRLDLTVFQLI